MIGNDSQEPQGPPPSSLPEVAAPETAPPPPPPPRSPLWGYKDLLVVLGLALPAFLAVIVASGIVMLVSPMKDKYVLALPSEFLGYLFWFILVAVYLRSKYNIRFWRALGWRWQPGYTMAAVLGGVALALTVGIAGFLLKTPRIEEGLIQELMKNSVTRIMVIISAITIGPICEELIFRGFVLPLLARTFGSAIGVMLTALPFALLHGPQYQWTWQLVLLIFVAGCAFGWTRLRTGSTATSTVMHSAYNAVFFVTYFFAQKGMEI